MLRSRILFALPVSAVLSVLVSAQTITAYFPDNVPTTGATNAFPFNTGAYTTLQVYPASGLTAAGIVAGQHLAGIAIAPTSGVAAGTYTAPTGVITIGHRAPTPPFATNQWLNNMVGAQTVWDTAVDGPLSFARVSGAWANLPFSPNAVFYWDGVSDLVLQISIGAGATGNFGLLTSPTTSYIRYGVNAVFAPAPGTAPTTTGVLGPRASFTFDFQNISPNWQVNQASASFDIDSQVGSAYGAVTVTRCINTTMTVNLGTSLTLPPWDLAIGTAPLVAANAGGITLPGGQFVNVNLADPTLTFLNGLTFTTPLAPSALPVALPAPIQFSLQMVVVDAGAAAGVSLSQPVALNVTATSAPIPGPAGDDVSLLVNLTGQPICGSPISFFGTSYSQMYVQTNGRVTFGTDSTAYTPSAAAANPGFVGAWADLNTTTAGSISISFPSAGVYSVDYNGVGFFGGPGTVTNTFQIVFDTNSGSILLGGLTGLATYTSQQLIGISPGASATNPGPRTWALGGPNAMSSPTDMIYTLTTAGAAIAGTGVNNLLFYPNLGGYDWTAF